MYYDSYVTAKPTSFGSKMNVKINQLLIKKITENIKVDNKVKVCEVGYGRGLFANAICKHFNGNIDYYAVEPNKQLAKDGRERGHVIVETKIPPFPSENNWNNFDIIIFSHVLEHFPDYETVLSVLNDSRNLLKENGIVVLFFPDFLDYGNDFYSADYSHEFITTERRVRQLVDDVQMKTVCKEVFRGSFMFPLTLIVYPFHLLIKCVAGALWALTGRDVFYKMKITFARNILIVAKSKLT